MLLGVTATQFCSDTARIWGVVGWVVFILKIVIPLALIVLGMVDLGKAVIASDDKAISKSVNQLLHRFIAAIVVFFVPTIVSAIFNAVLGTNIGQEGSGINQCVQCVTNVSSANCSSGIDAGVTY